MKPESEQLEDYLYAWDAEPPRKPYEKGKVDKDREAVRKQIKQLQDAERSTTTTELSR